MLGIRFPFELLPEATHWFEKDDERVCRTIYATSILWSKTLITDVETPAPRLEDFLEEIDVDQ